MDLREYPLFNKEEILPLYSSVGWTNYVNAPDMLERAYQNSPLKIGAFDGDKLIGVIRVVGDGESIVFIQDLLVLPEYQRKGIGTQLIRAVMERFPSVYQLELMTDHTEKTISFYKSLGFVKADETGCCAFITM